MYGYVGECMESSPRKLRICCFTSFTDSLSLCVECVQVHLQVAVGFQGFTRDVLRGHKVAGVYSGEGGGVV